MTDGSRYLMRSASCADYVIAVTETRNVTPRLGRDEVRALQVLADAGLVAAPAPHYRQAGRPNPADGGLSPRKSVVMIAGRRRSGL